MAETTFSQDQFSCPVCLDLLKDPVTLSCGHSYCMSCITSCFDQDEQKDVYSCPQCRQTFTPRPVLGKNVVLAEMLDKLVKLKLQTVVPAQCYAGPGEVECDVCTGRKYKAVKSCLVCMESYCQSHFERHEEFHSGKQHKITDATGRIQKKICHEHDRILEVYCRTDQQIICVLCMVDKHKNHNTVSVAAQRKEKERHFKETLRKFQQRIQEKEKNLQELRSAVESYKCSAQTAVKESERIFTELIRSIERRCSEVTQLIKDQEKAAVSQAEEFLKQLEQEIANLRRRDAELQEISHAEDIQFLQSFQSLSVLPTDSPNITVSSLLSFDNVQKSVSHLRKKLEDFCQEEIKIISGRVNHIQIIPVPEPKTREEFLQYRSRFTLDPNTVNKKLRLSEGNRMATYTNKFSQYPDHPDRFDYWEQVLCRERVCGRCYWEVELSRGVGISVAYKSISRKGTANACLLGYNGQSWKLSCNPWNSSFYHNNRETKLPLVSSSCIGVYVDHSAGTLSFYNVSDSMTLIHREQTTFTEPLYPGFRVIEESSVKLCDLYVSEV
ncbi:tripartite motif-containing protein 16-like protein [Ctenopharyngodon idella]|uniref:tripartite motif-containing protein 16-like protein n=1 Tax=Ctenopharyngodon idella TaxID=7959 RepID=UPI00222E9278|nr:tripartite motif-containing protein 16-like protein [Ctenopharyngodon idella]